MLPIACSTSTIGIKTSATDGAICEVLETPIDEAVGTMLEYQASTPPQVINGWTTVVKGFDAGCS